MEHRYLRTATSVMAFICCACGDSSTEEIRDADSGEPDRVLEDNQGSARSKQVLWTRQELQAADLPEELKLGFRSPAKLRIATSAKGGAVEANAYVLPQIDEEEVYDRVVQLMGHGKNFWYGDSGQFSYSSWDTDEEGVLDVVVPSGLAFRIEAWAQDREFGEAYLLVPALEEGESRRLEVELPSTPNLEFWGRLLLDGEPLPHIELAGLRYHTETGERVSSDEKGYFHVTVRDWLRPQLFLRATGAGPVLVHVLEGHSERETAYVIDLPMEATLEVRVDSDEKPAVTIESRHYHELPFRIDYHLGAHPPAWAASIERTTTGWVFRGLPSGADLELLVNGEKRTVSLHPGPNPFVWSTSSFERDD